MIFTVTAHGGLALGDRIVPCALGAGGTIPAEDKREGDGATPLGAWPLRRVLYRPDRGPRPRTALPASPLAPDDGWCDAPDDPAYNQPVKLPYRASAERLWRGDPLYDLVVVLGVNDRPPSPGRGSAIFLHLAHPDLRPTRGCVALLRADLEALLAEVEPGDALEVGL